MRILSAGETRLFQAFLETESRHHWEAYSEAHGNLKEWAGLAKSDARQCEVLATAFSILVTDGEELFFTWVSKRRRYWSDPKWPLERPHSS